MCCYCCCWLLFAATCSYLLFSASDVCPLLISATECCLFLIFAAVCCCWPLFPASCCYGLLCFCLVCFCLLLLLLPYFKNGSKMTPRAPKMVPKGAQMPPQIDPKWPLGAPQGHQEAQNPICLFEGPFLVQFWTPKGTPKSTKKPLFGEKSCCHVPLAVCFQPSRFCISFLLYFSSFFGRPNPWKHWYFLGKTTIFKKPLFFKKCPKEGPNDLKICQKNAKNGQANATNAEK